MGTPIFDRTDFLLTRVLVLLLAIGTPVLAVVLPVVRWVRGSELRWQLEGVGDARPPGGLTTREGVSLRGADSAGVRIEDAGWATWLTALVPGLVLSVGIVAVAVLLLRLLRRIQQGQPFVAASARALRLIGATTLTVWFLDGAAKGLADSVVSHRAFEQSVLGVSLDLSFIPLVGGLLVLALAEAFAQGIRLQADVEGLV